MTTTPVKGLSEGATVTIASGASLSSAAHLRGRIPVGIYMPSAWDAASITLQGCNTEGGTYVDIYTTAGAEFSVSAGVNRYIPLDPVPLYGVNFLKIRSGTSGTPVIQAAQRDLVLMTGRPPQ